MLAAKNFENFEVKALAGYLGTRSAAERLKLMLESYNEGLHKAKVTPVIKIYVAAGLL